MSESSTSPAAPAGAGPGPSVRNGPLSLSERVQSLRLPQGEAPPATWRTSLPWVLCALLAGTTAYLVLRDPPASEGQASPGETAAGGTQDSGPRSPTGLQVAADAVVLKLKGNITPIHQIQVSPKVSGMVERLFIKEGDVVKKGDKLAELETIEYDADYKHAVAAEAAARGRLAELKDYRDKETTQAKMELEECEAQREQLYLDWKRSIPLRGGALAAKDYEQAESSYRAMDRRVERLKLAWEFMAKRGPRDA